ncbi:DNA methylase [Blautia luti]|uniref:Y-family DNA polymerase n=1 Tax=Blautia luti TaxID=89014 RepID=UPI00156F1281|nr:DNA methylase [Blautia luti]NSK43994.1 DNA methylase [Blautia luti]
MDKKEDHIYIAIDLKSFYASVECQERNLNPLTTNLVVADRERTEKTICLAVSPSLKAYGIPGRARLFEVVQRVKEVNQARVTKAPRRCFTGESWSSDELKAHPELAVSYVTAPPRMALYMDYSTRIYNVYLRYLAPEDMHVYSIDEVFMDVTHYLGMYQMTAREFAAKMISDVMKETGITATAGIGTNLYLCKIAMDIGAKHVTPDENGVRIAELTEQSYRELLWDHRPLTDFWRVGTGIRKNLEEVGLYTMGDIARCSLGGVRDYYNEDLLYKIFGINAELLIDHAWGYEPVTMDLIKAYKPETNSIGSGQVLHCPSDFEQAKLIVREMTDMLVLQLVEKRLVTSQIVLTIGYDIDNLKSSSGRKKYQGEIKTDRYGRKIPKHGHGTVNLDNPTSSTSTIMKAVLDLYERITDKTLLIRRVYITANQLTDEKLAAAEPVYQQMNLFTDYLKSEVSEAEQKAEKEKQEKERKLQEAMLSVKKKFGKNAILKGSSLQEGSTTIERNNQIGGHRA